MTGLHRRLGMMAIVALCAGGCMEPYAPLVARPSPDCSQPAPFLVGVDITVSGHTPERVNWMGCDKSSANLAGASLGTAILVGTNFSSANLEGADLGAANLSGANLSNASLRGADLTGIGARRASFANANLTGATIAAGTFYDADFSGATWVDGVRICQGGSIGICR